MATNFHIRYTCKLKWKWRIYPIFLGPLGFSGCLAKCAAHLLFLRALGLPHIKKSSKQSCETKHHRSLLGQSVAHFLYNVDDSRIHVYFIKKKLVIQSGQPDSGLKYQQCTGPRQVVGPTWHKTPHISWCRLKVGITVWPWLPRVEEERGAPRG